MTTESNGVLASGARPPRPSATSAAITFGWRVPLKLKHVFLVQADGPVRSSCPSASPAGLDPAWRVTDIVNQRHIVGSNLTAVERSGLTRIELGFALVLAAGASGLALGLGSQERRRTFAIASAPGARTRQLGGFVWGESIFVTAGGLILGGVIATVLSITLTDVLTGVFDPAWTSCRSRGAT